MLKRFWVSYKFLILLFCGISIGSILGLTMGEGALIFKPLGDIFLNLMFTIVVPLVFVTISSSISAMLDMKRLGKILGSLLFTFASTGIIASIIMLIVTYFLKPGASLEPVQNVEELAKIVPGTLFVNTLTVPDFVGLLSRKNMMPLIVFSIFFGLATASIGEAGKPIANALDSLSKVLQKLISYIMLYAPIGLGAYFASTVAEYGPQLITEYASAISIYYVVCIIYFFLAFFLYSYIAGGMDAVKIFFKNITPAALTALATQSSIATLPTNLECTKKMGVPKDIREIVLPIGATMHMDGTCLSSIFKITFLFGFYNMPFHGIGTYIGAIIISVIGGVVMSGIPGGGLVGEMLIISVYGFKPEALPILVTIGFLVDPPATMVNATGDSVASMLVTRLIEGKDWLKKNLV